MTARTKVKRKAARGKYDRDTVHDILDEAFLCHVAYVDDGQPIIIPTAYCRMGDKVYLHGHISNRLLKNVQARTTTFHEHKLPMLSFPLARM